MCAEPRCPVGYHGDDGAIVPVVDLVVRPGYKDASDPLALLCYCFLHTRGDVQREAEGNGVDDILSAVRAAVAIGNCACEVRNPRGVCCIGDIKRAVRNAPFSFGSGVAGGRTRSG